jgi:hypothetical protein
MDVHCHINVRIFCINYIIQTPCSAAINQLNATPTENPEQ